MKDYFTPFQLKIFEIARNWLIAIVAGLAFCIATVDDMHDAELTQQQLQQLTVNAKRQAMINAKADEIAVQMLASQEAKGAHDGK
ncbi:hypothetical protein DTO96_102170 [Ephemeroptericola cinctiostellae]|uniref:Uncharacterized protein n=1 Tax=Ephemeroptericola cinctiostellae TaxID=2268024 RepID=A0A345DDH8_9BURK|nr:hypothetical protein [Ephemeroptericola cinctiostellae]AXF86416.1 hypothetical protein DTO96_102170 [Ephemeroptericola cinctiostellae]